MRRLRDEIDSPDPVVSQAARLVAQVAPLEESEVRAQRVRRALDRAPRARRFAGWSVAFGVTLGVVGTAGAVVGVVNWMSSRDGSEEAREPRRMVAQDGPQAARAMDDDGDVGSTGDGAKEAGAAATAPRESQQPGLRNPSERPVSSEQVLEKPSGSRFAAGRAASRGDSNPSRVPLPSEAPQETPLSEARLMQQAVEALRTSGDANKAEGLLREYRKTSTSGQLDEEALALSIEVSLARGDGKASTYARQYLAKYPSGKFAPLARKALSKAGTPASR